jgi:hypothetical protein
VLFVNVDGIQQNPDHGDYITDQTGIIFAQAPRNGADIAVFVLWTGIGEKLAGSAFPQTIQWDWAYWDYADLGRQEYDFAGLFIGNGISDSFTVPIPQQTSLLYSVQIRFYQNGVLTPLTTLGLTMTTTKLATGVVVFLSGPLPSDVYGALYVSRGLYEGLEPTFGFQDPNGIIFGPTPSTYQHFFARLISATFDPSVDMVGCPNHSPEERIQTFTDDLWTIAVKTFALLTPELQTTSVFGVSANTAVGSFAFFIDNNPGLSGQEGLAEIGEFAIINQPPPFNMTGLDAPTSTGNFVIDIDPASIGQEATSMFGTFAFFIDTNPPAIGEEATAEVGVFGLEFSAGSIEATAEFGDFTFGFDVFGLSAISDVGSYTLIIDYPPAGLEAVSQIGVITAEPSIPIVGVEALSEFGSFTFIVDGSPDLSGLGAVAEFGNIIASLTYAVTGEEATASVGNINNDIGPAFSGVGATAEAGYFRNTTVMLNGIGATTFVGLLLSTTNEETSGLEAMSDIGSFVPSVGTMFSGVGATAEAGYFRNTTVMLNGMAAAAAVGNMGPHFDRGVAAASEVGILIPTVTLTLPSVSTTAQAGTIYPSPVLLSVGGRQANTQPGTITVSTSF